MSEYQLSNLHVVTHEVTGAARSVWWGALSLKISLNTVWGGTWLSDPRGLVHLFHEPWLCFRSHLLSSLSGFEGWRKARSGH